VTNESLLQKDQGFGKFTVVTDVRSGWVSRGTGRWRRQGTGQRTSRGRRRGTGRWRCQGTSRETSWKTRRKSSRKTIRSWRYCRNPRRKHVHSGWLSHAPFKCSRAKDKNQCNDTRVTGLKLEQGCARGDTICYYRARSCCSAHFFVPTYDRHSDMSLEFFRSRVSIGPA
jgi:hypothetical protein